MTSDYQLWLTHNNETEKLQFPYLPERINVKIGSRDTSVDIAGLGEIIITQGRPAIVVSFSSFFPAYWFAGLQTDPEDPWGLAKRINEWKNSGKPSHLILTGTPINMFGTISDFPLYEEGGDVGTVHFSLTIKEHRDPQVRKVNVNTLTKAAVIVDGPTRTDNRVQAKTHTVVKGDALWMIAHKHLGDGDRYKEIYNLNQDLIKDKYFIYPGQILKLPT